MPFYGNSEGYISPWGENQSRGRPCGAPENEREQKPEAYDERRSVPAKTVREDLPGGRRCHRRISCANSRGINPFKCENAFTAGEELYSKPAQAITEPCCDARGCDVFNADRRSTFWPDFARPRWLACGELYV